ncbi:MAG: 30S ribosomal protein S10 [Candidatus Woesearchaeota archaeon]
MAYARIKITSTEIDKINELIAQIKDISEKAGVKLKGPIPLPTKVLRIATMRNAFGRGYETIQRFEMRIHKRIVDMELNDNALRMIMRVPISHGVNVEIEIVN